MSSANDFFYNLPDMMKQAGQTSTQEQMMMFLIGYSCRRMTMSVEQNIFQGIQDFQAEYNKAVNKKLRQIKVLHEIGGSGAERLIRDVKARFDDELLVIQKKRGASIRHYVAMIEDETLKKKVRYKANMCIRHPEKCDTFKTADDFYRWCGVDSKFFYEKSLTKKVNKPP